MCVVLEYSSQGANGVKENRPLFSLLLNSMFGTVLVDHTHTQDVSGSRLQIPPAASWRPPPEGPVDVGGKEVKNVKSQRSLRK